MSNEASPHSVKGWWLTFGISGIILALIPIIWAAASGSGDNVAAVPGPTVTSSSPTPLTTTPPPEPDPTTSTVDLPLPAAPAIEASPDSARPGTTVTIRGSGFRAGKQYVVAMTDLLADDDSMTRVKGVEATTDGRLRASFPMPLWCEGFPLPIFVFDALDMTDEPIAEAQVFVTNSSMGAC